MLVEVACYSFAYTCITFGQDKDSLCLSYVHESLVMGNNIYSQDIFSYPEGNYMGQNYFEGTVTRLFMWGIFLSTSCLLILEMFAAVLAWVIVSSSHIVLSTLIISNFLIWNGTTQVVGTFEWMENNLAGSDIGGQLQDYAYKNVWRP